MEAMKDYVAHLDNKKRITLRGAAYQYYNVKEYGNGCIILEPRELTVPESISARTLADMDRAVSSSSESNSFFVIQMSNIIFHCFHYQYLLRKHLCGRSHSLLLQYAFLYFLSIQFCLFLYTLHFPDTPTPSRIFIVPSTTPALFLFPPALPRSL